MYSSNSAIYAANYQARSLCPQRASKEKHRFLLGTCSLHEENELTVLEYREDTNQIEAVSVFSHPDQIWALDSSPTDPSLVITSHQSLSSQPNITLWKMPNQSMEDIESRSPTDFLGDRLPLESLASSTAGNDTTDSLVQNISWHPFKNSILTTSSDNLIHWTLGESEMKNLGKLTLTDPVMSSPPSPSPPSSNLEQFLRTLAPHQHPHHMNPFSSLFPSDSSSSSSSLLTLGSRHLRTGVTCWDKHHPLSFAVGYGSSFSLVDSRKMNITGQVLAAHEGNIKDIDYNPNKPLMLVTCGEDRKIRFWDLRNFSRGPVRTLSGGHSHWVCGVQYNPFHDQLLISGGSDHLVNLWRVGSVSSAPWVGSEGSSSSSSSSGSLQTEEEEKAGGGGGGGGGSFGRNLEEEGEGGGDPADIRVRVSDHHEDSVYGLAWSPCDPWIYTSLSYDGRVTVDHVPSTEKYQILL